MTGPEHLRLFLATATADELEAVRAEAEQFKDVGPKLSEVMADWDRQAPVLEAFEASRFNKIDEFFNSLSAEEFEDFWERVLSRRPGAHHVYEGPSPIEVFNEFFDSLTDREFSHMWARVKRQTAGGPRAKKYQAYINRMKERRRG